MTKLLPIIILVVLTSCGNSDKDNLPAKDTITNRLDTLVTPRLLSFVIYLDSIGFNCDTNRLVNIYSNYSKAPRYYINNHFFYGSMPETSGQHFYINSFVKNKENDQEWNSYTKAIKAYKSVVWYFFSDLKPGHLYGEKWYKDGIIEEWEFKDSFSAKTAANSISAIIPQLYFKAGAFVCYVDNHMYIISSRSTESMIALGPVFDTFATRNKVTITNRDKWY